MILNRMIVETWLPWKEKCTVSLQNMVGLRTFLNEGETVNKFKAQEST